MISSILVPLAAIFFSIRYAKNDWNSTLLVRVKTFYNDLNLKHRYQAFYNVFFLFRRIVFGLTLIYLQDYVFLQIFIYNFGIIFQIIYLILGQPFQDPALTKLELFNEFTLLASLYHIFFFTNYFDDAEMKFNIGWSCIIVIMINVSVNFYAMIKNII